MAIEKAATAMGFDIPNSYNKNVWINLNGHGGSFTAEVTMHMFKDKAARDASSEPIERKNIVLSDTPENKAAMDQIRTLVYGMISREEAYKTGKKV